MKIYKFFVKSKKVKKNKRKDKTNVLLNIFLFFMIGVVAVSSYYLADNIRSVRALPDNNSMIAIYNGNENNNNVSLMINVYWGTEFVEPMLEVLEDKGVKATFFLGGTWASGNEELVKRMYEEGHEIGNHGYYHKDHTLINEERNIEEIDYTHKVVKSMTGLDMNLFAPPSGSYNDTVISVASDAGYKTIMWSKDTIDWRDKDATLIHERATTELKNGDLILMHPTAETLAALPSIIDDIKSAEFNISTVSENIK